MEDLSYIHTPSTSKFFYATFSDLLLKRYKESPSKEAVVIYKDDMTRDALTFAELYKGSKEIAYGLRSLTRHHDYDEKLRVAVVGANSRETFMIVSAVLELGGAVVFLPHDIDSCEQLKKVLAKTNCKCFFFQWVYMKLDELEKLALFLPDLCLIGYGKMQTELKNCSITPLSKLQKTAKFPNEDFLKRLNNPDSDALVFFTSGSTGNPKAVAYSHFQIFNNSLVLAEELGLNRTDIYFSDRSIAHNSSFPTIFWFLVSDIVCVCVDTHVSKTDIHCICNIIEWEKCTVAFTFGYILFDMIRNPEISRQSFKCLRLCLTAGQMLNQSFAENFKQILPGAKLVNAYGTTETMYGIITPKGSSLLADGFIGSPLPGLEMKLVDENNVLLHRGEVGELFIRTPFMSSGYLHSTGKHAIGSPEGWFQTGDLAVMDTYGRIKIVDRKLELITRAGFKIQPSYIEKRLAEHPEIKAVQVIGVPDERLGEEICACAIPSGEKCLTANEVLRWGEDKFKNGKDGINMAPKYAVLLDEFPRLPSGKVSRKELKTICSSLVNEAV